MPSSADTLPSALVVEHGHLRDVPPVAGWLGVDESEVAAAFRMESRRRSWILGRWTAKRAAMRLAGAPHDADPRRWSIVAAADGAPEVFLEGTRQPVSVSLSHRSGFALAVAAGHPLVVGCDLELLEPRSETFIDDYFVDTEKEFVRSVPADAGRELRANLVWCAKEAALKVIREGLRRDTRSVIARFVASPPGSDWRRFEVLDTTDSSTFPGWWRVAGGFVETVALRDGRGDR